MCIIKDRSYLFEHESINTFRSSSREERLIKNHVSLATKANIGRVHYYVQIDNPEDAVTTD